MTVGPSNCFQDRLPPTSCHHAPLNCLKSVPDSSLMSLLVRPLALSSASMSGSAGQRHLNEASAAFSMVDRHEQLKRILDEAIILTDEMCADDDLEDLFDDVSLVHEGPAAKQ